MKRNMILPVGKDTFERVARGIQTEIYRTYSDFWLKKLYYPRTFRPRYFEYVTITTGKGEERKSLKITLKGIETKQNGRYEWDAPKGKVFILYIDQIEKNDY